MKNIAAFFQLIRWPNLVFIVLTQVLFYFVVFYSILEPGNDDYLFDRTGLFFLLIAASVLIAAAGYIINDYFDVPLDVVNKPGRVIVTRIMNRRWAMLLHMLFSLAGICISLYVSYRTKSLAIAFGNISCVILLWFYSTWFKRTLLIGNVTISLLTAWVTGVVYFFAGAKVIYLQGWLQAPYPFDIRRLFILTLMYSGFAFIVSLVREAIKDMEDLHGDAKYGCRTMPVVWGIPATKVYIAVWLTVILASLGIIIFYAVQSGWWLSAFYGLAFIVFPFVQIFRKLKASATPEDYHALSNRVKLVMLTGILSMLFFISPIR